MKGSLGAAMSGIHRLLNYSVCSKQMTKMNHIFYLDDFISNIRQNTGSLEKLTIVSLTVQFPTEILHVKLSMYRYIKIREMEMCITL